MAYDFHISGEIIEWRGPAPFHFVRINPSESSIIKSQMALLSYGWGVVPVHGRLGTTNFSTSLIPRDDAYLIPIKDVVRKAESLSIGDPVIIELNLGKAPRPQSAV